MQASLDHQAAQSTFKPAIPLSAQMLYAKSLKSFLCEDFPKHEDLITPKHTQIKSLLSPPTEASIMRLLISHLLFVLNAAKPTRDEKH